MVTGHFVAHYHEIALKGKNRSLFVERLVLNIKLQLAGVSIISVRGYEGRIVISHENDSATTQEIKKRLAHVFGISSYAPAHVVPADIDEIKNGVVRLIAGHMKTVGAISFAVRTKRSDKRFPYTSSEVNGMVGGAVVDALHAKVDLEKPEVVVSIEILSHEAYVMFDKYAGPGGLPVGMSGRAVALLSGGIDSPVAAWRVMKRGAEIIFVHFHSYPHTSRASIEKVRRLAEIVGAYQTSRKIYFIPFAEAQREIVMRADPKYRVILYRRLMMRIAARIGQTERAGALVTGESLGQVASQTMENIAVTDASAALPVFRPLIGSDKEEIIARAKKIETYETSIEPHDDCCTLFMPKNPVTRARLVDVLREEAKFDSQKLIDAALEKAEINESIPTVNLKS